MPSPPPKSAAVLFGINYYRTPGALLRGCINDVNNMAKHLKGKYDKITVHTDQIHDFTTSAKSIIRSLQSMARDSHRYQLEKVWIHFSGHGCYIPDDDGDEIDGQDECICPSDFRLSGVITDDTIKTILRNFYSNTRITCIFDCCHSGSICDLKYLYDIERSTSIPTSSYAPCSPKVFLISGCMDNQTSADAYNVRGKREFSGAMTSCLLLLLEDENDLVTAYKKLTTLIKEKRFSQSPQLTSSFPICGPFLV
jgi:hypothetical protein